MNLVLLASLFAAGLFILMLAFIEVGRRIGAARLARDPDGLGKGVSAVEGAVFALLGLMIAFTFSGAASRFEDRRHLITQEANAIGTAYLRIDLLPGDAQAPLRELFRRYLDLRLEQSRNSGNLPARAMIASAAVVQRDIWNNVLAVSHSSEAAGQGSRLLILALNPMFDIATTRAMATQSHPPAVIYLLLAGLGLIGSLLVGYSMSANKNRTSLHAVLFAAVISLVLYLILDLEYPRLGLIRVDAADEVLIELRQSMQ
jgi:hypothetical protein